ncbi:mRNA interferase [Spirochaetia bacterium]|nr:mRNA interferase [Spirochaetia bacterium]
MEQYDIWLVNLDPTIGHEIQKTRPCVIISPDEMNHHLKTIIVAPMTTKAHGYPMRVKMTFQKKSGWIVLDQIRTIDKIRMMKKLGALNSNKTAEVKQVLLEMLVN